VLVPGMTFCIEPMFTLGSKEVKILPDGWTAVSKDNSLSAHLSRADSSVFIKICNSSKVND
ncbi:MAG: hypothetical protein Q8847_02620, partial [Sweet potato little leaf phytoplasma]|nr:hypothetical protein [Sweet potato little leaf phytoplasma]